MLMFTGAGMNEAKRNSAKATILPCLHIGLGLSYQVEPQTDWSITRP